MNTKDIKKNIRIAEGERVQSLAKSKAFEASGHPKSSLVYKIRHDALVVYIEIMHKKLIMHDRKTFKKVNN